MKDRYSRMVLWLKVGLPLAALAILSTLFSYTRNSTPLSLPFSKSEVEQRLKGEQISKPVLTGSSAQGDQFSLAAQEIRYDSKSDDTTITDFLLHIDLASGGHISIGAQKANLNPTQDYLSTSGHTSVETGNGYEIRTEKLQARLNSIDIFAPSTITAIGPLGEIRAGNMQISASGSANTVHLVFKQGVNVLYTPKTK